MLPITFGFLLHDAARLMRREFDRRAKSSGLTRAQWAVLASLARNEGSNQTALAEVLDIEPITLVRLIDKLEDAGWVERRADPDDRRVRRLFLTATARPLMQQFRDLADATNDAALLGLDAADRRQLFELLTKVRANLSGRDLAPDTAALSRNPDQTKRVSENA